MKNWFRAFAFKCNLHCYKAERISEAAAARRDAERLQAVLLRLLITWLHGCLPAVNAFLAPAAHLPMLADLARAGAGSAGSPHVAGLASVLLGGAPLQLWFRVPPPFLLSTGWAK